MSRILTTTETLMSEGQRIMAAAEVTTKPIMPTIKIVIRICPLDITRTNDIVLRLGDLNLPPNARVNAPST